MNKKSLRAGDYLAHMLDAIQRIRRYARNKSEAEFFADEQLQDAVIRNIEIIGEAARNITMQAPEFAKQNASVPWAALYAMRNRVSHGYWVVDVAVVWQVVERDLAQLEAQILALPAAGDPPPGAQKKP